MILQWLVLTTNAGFMMTRKRLKAKKKEFKKQ